MSLVRADVERARTRIDTQLRAYHELAGSLAGLELNADTAAAAVAVSDAWSEFDSELFGNLTLALAQLVGRTVPGVGDLWATPLGELDMVVDALAANDGVFRTGTSVDYEPVRTVLGLHPGHVVRLTADSFARLAEAVFAEVDRMVEDSPS